MSKEILETDLAMIRHLKKCIRSNSKELDFSNFTSVEDCEHLMRWCDWLYKDLDMLKELWKKKDSQGRKE